MTAKPPRWTRVIICTLAAAMPLGGFVAPVAAIDFNREIRPILSDKCFFCHGPDQHERKAGLRLDTYEGATADNDGVRAIDPEDAAMSELLARIVTDDEDEVMPPPDSNKRLTSEEVALLRRWIEEGAPWAEHWAFVPPGRPPLPEVKNRQWGRGPIDAFILARIESAGLQPSPEASREVLLRRVTFDLTGLPPTIGEVDAFLSDRSPDAYERVVDRLLASESYGERMALAWMDIARYGDTSVMHADGPRDMWPWRDWVIRAYNANMPFDRFTVEQLAGDLLPDPTVDQQIATGFNRNHATSDEGGAIPEELRVEYVVDRVQTTANAWLGLTMECGQCHDHKYDPISQQDYYRFFAYFNSTRDEGMQTRNGNAEPVVRFFADPELEREHAEAVAALEQQRLAVDGHRSAAGPAFEQWVAEASAAGADALPPPDGLRHRFERLADDGSVVDSESGALAGQPAEDGVSAPEWREIDGREAFAFTGARGVSIPGDFGDREHDGAFSFAAWVRPSDGASGALFSRMDEGNAHRGYDFWFQNGQVGAHIVHQWPDNALKVVSEQRLKPDAWQHVVVSYDGSGKAAGVEITIDGQASKTVVEKDSLNGTIRTEVPFRLGSRSQGAGFSGAASDIRIYDRALTVAERERIGPNRIGGILAKAAGERTDDERNALLEHYLGSIDGTYPALVARRTELEAAVRDLEGRRISSMIMSDRDEPRPTYVLNRGAYDSPRMDELVQPGVPAALPPLPEGAPPNRLGLARWLVQPDHPLTARVAVNRYWTMLFGTGLVETVADFGSQGTPPTHPELLDWLAVDFVESGWDVKRMLRQIVTSATYRQSSRATPERLEDDPRNLLLARGPRFRLQGEFLRDNALAVSGLLVPKVGGPGTKPYQPPGLWNEVSLDGNVRFTQDSGEALYRRSMYIYWKRSAPHPGMMAFDAPTREKCAVERARTNTPLQALVTLNDVQFVEASRVLAERILKEAESANGDRIRHAFRLVLGRLPDEREIGIVESVLARQIGIFAAAPGDAESLVGVGEHPRDPGIDPVELAAWTSVATMLLNLDETITRG